MSESAALRPAGVTLLAISVCTMLATLMQSLDTTIANVALPYMQGSLSASQDEINWVLTSYIIASAIMTAPVGFLTARFGRTRLFVMSIAGFTIASAACGLAQSIGQIVLFRLLQGACGAAVIPLSQAVLQDIFPTEKRGPAMALWGMGVQVGPILGPIVGGWLTQELSWRWVFYVNVPFGIIAAIGLLIFMKETPASKAIRIDWLGFLSLGLAIAALQLMLDRGEELDWFSSPEIILEACISGLGFYIFLLQTVLSPKPFLSPRLFTDLNFVVGILLMFIVSMSLYATLALLAPYLQDLAGDPVSTAGFLLAPRGIGTVISMLICGQLVRRVDVRLLSGFGLACNTLAMYETSAWLPQVAESTIIWVGILQGISVGFVFVALSSVLFNTLPPELRTEAAGVYNLMRNLGSAIGISVTGALLISNTQINHEIIGAVATPFNHLLQSGGAGMYWNPTMRSGAAALNTEITRQSTIISYADNFTMMMMLGLITLPTVLLLPRPRAGRTERRGDRG